MGVVQPGTRTRGAEEHTLRDFLRTATLGGTAMTIVLTGANPRELTLNCDCSVGLKELNGRVELTQVQ